MTLTKNFFQKKGTLGYHFIQSFKGYEVLPKKANLLGKQLTEELWGDKYQIVICTHTNKENVHNHIILNSVSFVDKYCALHESFKHYKKNIKLQKFYRYAYIFFGLMIFKSM